MASVLKDTQLHELRRRLEQERARILRVLRATLDAPQPDQETEFEEAAQREAERTHDDEVAARERVLLAEVERALAKFDNGQYGVGERTGAPIPYERLAAMPWARDAIEE
jgi:RNA polymerase-binding transcription factor